VSPPVNVPVYGLFVAIKERSLTDAPVATLAPLILYFVPEAGAVASVPSKVSVLDVLEAMSAHWPLPVPSYSVTNLPA